MTKAVTDKIDMDLTKPLNMDDIEIASDCFSKEYDPSDVQCSICAVHEICGILWQKTAKKLGSTIKKPSEVFVDEWNFKAVPKDNIIKLVTDNPNTYSVQDIFNVIKEKSNCDDLVTVKIWMKNFILDNGLGTNNGKLYVK